MSEPVEIVRFTVEVEVFEKNLWRTDGAHLRNLRDRIRKAIAAYPNVVKMSVEVTE